MNKMVASQISVFRSVGCFNFPLFQFSFEAKKHGMHALS